MSDLAYTPTRQMAQSAAIKAQDGYALARQMDEKLRAVREIMDDLRSFNAAMAGRVEMLETIVKVLREELDARPQRRSKVLREELDARPQRRKAA